MTILWLVLKIILITLLGILGVGVVLILAVVFLPIAYNLEYEKYNEQQFKGSVKLFYFISLLYTYESNDSVAIIKVFGIPIKTIDSAEQESPVEGEQDHDEDEHSERTGMSATSNIAASQRDLESNKQVQPDRESIINTKRLSQAEHTSANTKDKEKQKKSKQPTKNKTKQPPQTDYLDLAKQLWQSPDRNECFKAVVRLLGQLIKTIKPKRFYFDLLIGLENPADTGELIAKLTMAYPLYYKYGRIDGHYIEAGFWGELQASGKLSIYQILKPVVCFVLNKHVRRYINIILDIRKVDKNGI